MQLGSQTYILISEEEIMGRVVYFEIHVDDMKHVKKFYSEVFGWTYED